MGNKQSSSINHPKLGWTKLDAPPKSMPTGDAVQINSNEIIVATIWNWDVNDTSYKDQYEKPGIYIYNTITREWKLWLKYHSTTYLYVRIMFDKPRNALYLLSHTQIIPWDEWAHRFTLGGPAPGKLEMINLDTKECKRVSDEIREMYPVNLKDTILIFGGVCANSKSGFNKITRKYTSYGTLFHENLIGVLCVYIESKNVILIFGGCSHVKSENYGMMEISVPGYEWTYIKNVSSKYKDKPVGKALLTMDEKHVILIHPKVIFIVDILDNGEYKLRKSKVKLPFNKLGICVLTDSNDVALIFGYVRDLDLNISRDIMDLIVSYTDFQLLNVIYTEDSGVDRSHYVIDVSCILME